MKETKVIALDNVAEVRPIQHKKQLKAIGQMLPGDGHHLYEFNSVTYELRKVKAEDNKSYAYVPARPGAILGPKDRAAKSFEIKENCLYLFALNEKNAVKKVNKRFKVPCVIVILDE